MVLEPKRMGALVLRLIVVLLLLGCPRMASAQGTWSVIPLPQKPGEVVSPRALAADAAGNLYVAEGSPGGRPEGNDRIQKRDAQGNWSILATAGDAPGQVVSPSALAVDAAGNLYVADYPSNPGRIQKRDAQGNWSVIVIGGMGLGQVYYPPALAVDTAGNLYVAGSDYDSATRKYVSRIQKRDVQGSWSVIATYGTDPGQVSQPTALAVDTAGNLYVAEWLNNRIQKRDTQGNWSILATVTAYALAVDTAGNLYVADYPSNPGPGRIQKRDAQGNWSLIAIGGMGLGQVYYPRALAVDTAGNLYVADGLDRIQKRDAQGNWSLIATPGELYFPYALAVDTAGNLYVAYSGRANPYPQIQKQDVQGNWSLIAIGGMGLGQVYYPRALAVDAAGSLYVADALDRIQKRDAQGNWSVIATSGLAPGQVRYPSALAADSAGNLYVAEERICGIYFPCDSSGRIQKRDVQGSWSVIATYGRALGQVSQPTALAVDGAGNLYVADWTNDRLQKRYAQGNWSDITPDSGLGGFSALAVDAAGNLYVNGSGDYGLPRIQKRDAQGNWSVLATYGRALGQVDFSYGGLAVDGAGNLYVADSDNNRVQEYTPHP